MRLNKLGQTEFRLNVIYGIRSIHEIEREKNVPQKRGA